MNWISDELDCSVWPDVGASAYVEGRKGTHRVQLSSAAVYDAARRKPGRVLCYGVNLVRRADSQHDSGRLDVEWMDIVLLGNQWFGKLQITQKSIQEAYKQAPDPVPWSKMRGVVRHTIREFLAENPGSQAFYISGEPDVFHPNAWGACEEDIWPAVPVGEPARAILDNEWEVTVTRAAFFQHQEGLGYGFAVFPTKKEAQRIIEGHRVQEQFKAHVRRLSGLEQMYWALQEP